MDIRLEHSAVKLTERGTISVVDGKGTRVAVTVGTVWITQDEDRRDVLLGSGESFVLDRDGTTIVEALADAIVEIDAPGPCVDAAPASRSNLTSLAVLGRARHPRVFHASAQPA